MHLERKGRARSSIRHSELEASLVLGAGLKAGGDGVVNDAVAAGLGSEADGEGALERGRAVKRPGVGRRLLERREIVGALLDLHLGDGDAQDEDQAGLAAARAGLEGERAADGQRYWKYAFKEIRFQFEAK